MKSKEQGIIEGLFQRLKQAEKTAEPRDAEAEKKIQSLIQDQPSAPYYMAQSIIIQEIALNRLNQQVQQLQNEISELRATHKPTKGGFLSGLFDSTRPKRPQQPQVQMAPPSYSGFSPPSNMSNSGGFISGALQTAAGVAGGMVLGNMLTNMFHHTSPEEIVNIIDDPTAAITRVTDPLLNQNFDASDLDTFNDISDRNFIDQNNALSNNEWGADDYSNDDDSFL